MKLYIHIGSDKCGSTAIQTSLFLNREEVIRQGVYLPKSGLGTNSGHGHCFTDQSGKTFQALINELKSVEDKYKLAVISWEGIHFLKPEKMERLYSQLKEFKSTALYYVRDQAEIIQTGILQQWKTSNCRIPFSPRVPPTRLYHNIAEQWSSFLGNKTQVSQYDRKKFPGGDITLDFYSKIGLKNTQNIIPLKSDINKSLAFESGFLIAMLDRQFPLPLPQRQKLVDALLAAQTEFNLTKCFFSKAEVEEIRGYYSENNKLLVSQYGLESFSTDSSCWRRTSEEFSIHPSLLAKTLELYDIPVLEINNLKIQQLQNILKEGWFNVENWGVWAQGNISVLKFRVTARDLMSRYARKRDLSINIQGNYFASVEKKSGIRVNGGNQEKVNLSNYTFNIAIDKIPQDRCFEVVIENFENVSPLELDLRKDDRMLSFGLRRISLR